MSSSKHKGACQPGIHQRATAKIVELALSLLNERSCCVTKGKPIETQYLSRSACVARISSAHVSGAIGDLVCE